VGDIGNSLDSKISALHESIEELTIKVNNLCEDNNLLKKKFEDTICSNELPNLSPLLNTDNVTNESLSNLAATIISEQQEKEKCQLNLVINNIYESILQDDQARKQEDISKVNILSKPVESELFNCKCCQTK